MLGSVVHAQGADLQRLGELHLKACKLARPNPKELAERLFRCETSSPFDSFYDSARTYRDVLGDAGLQRPEERRVGLYVDRLFVVKGAGW